MRAAFASALAFVILAGCVQPALQTSSLPVPASPALDKVMALLEGVPCEAPVEAGKTSANLVTLALAPLEGMHAEIDVRGSLLASARYQAGGFDVLDVSDPTSPVLVGTFEGEKTTALDVKWSESGDAVFLGNSDGVQLVDARDPANPALASKWTGRTAHMLDVHTIGGKEWVFLAGGDDDGVGLLERDGWELKPHAEIKHAILTGGPIGPHDVTVLVDETLQKPVLYVANGFEGWLAFDVSDPTKPKELGGMINLDPAQGYLHTIQAEKIGDRRIVTTISEVGVNALKVWDATDFSKPVLLAEWQADPTHPTLPQHNLQLLHGRLYMAHYGMGVFAFDLTKLGSTPYLGTLDLKPVAHFQPPRPESGIDPVAFTNVWDVNVKDGVLFVSDENEGVHALGFGCIAPGDVTQTSRG
jgi:hypothetical protein